MEIRTEDGRTINGVTQDEKGILSSNLMGALKGVVVKPNNGNGEDGTSVKPKAESREKPIVTKPTEEVKKTPKSDIDDLNVFEAPDEGADEVFEQEIHDSEWAERAGGLIYANQKKLQEYLNHVGFKNTDKGKRLIYQVQQALSGLWGKFYKQDEEMQNHVQYCILRALVEDANPLEFECMHNMMEKLVEADRYRILKKEEIKNLPRDSKKRKKFPLTTQHLGGNSYVSCRPDGILISGHDILEKAVWRQLITHRKCALSHIIDPNQANHDLRGLLDGESPVPGRYYLFIPPGTYPMAHLIIEIRDRNADRDNPSFCVAEPKMALGGSTTPLTISEWRRYMPWWWMVEGSVKPTSRNELSNFQFDLSVKMLRSIQNAMWHWCQESGIEYPFIKPRFVENS